MVKQLPQADRPEVVLPPPPEEASRALDDALTQEGPDARRGALQRVVKAWPTYLEAWARLSDAARDEVEAYAYARVGYHRALDALRANGWGGNGFVRWRHETNRGALLSMEALRTAAAAIGEPGEPERLARFLVDLDPDWSTPID